MPKAAGTQFFTVQPSTQPPIPAPAPGLGRRALDNTAWAAGKTFWAATRPLAWAASPLGDGLGEGLSGRLKEELSALAQPDGPLGAQLRETLTQALLRQPPQELLHLQMLLRTLLTSPQQFQQEHLEQLHALIEQLLNEDARLLKELAPDLSAEGLALCQQTLNFFQDQIDCTERFFDTAPEDIAGPPPVHSDGEEEREDAGLQSLQEVVASGGEQAQNLHHFHSIIDTVMARHRGALTHALCSVSEFIEDLKHKGKGEMGSLVQELEHTLWAHPPEELIHLRESLSKMISPEQLFEVEDVIRTAQHLHALCDGDAALLKDSSAEERELFRGMCEFFNTLATHAAHQDPKTHLQGAEIQKGLKHFRRTVSRLLEGGQGPMTKLSATIEGFEGRFFEGQAGHIPKTLATVQATIRELSTTLEGFERRFFEGPAGHVPQTLSSLKTTLEGFETRCFTDPTGHVPKTLGAVQATIKELSTTLEGFERRFFEGPASHVPQTLSSMKTTLEGLETRCFTDITGHVPKTLAAVQAVLQEPQELLTREAHPLLSQTHQTVVALRKAVFARDAVAIRKQSRALEEQIDELIPVRASVFTRAPLQSADQQLLERMRGLLPTFYAPTDASSHATMVAEIEMAFAVIDRYYLAHAGTAERVGGILKATLNPLIERVEQLPQQMLGNVFGVVPPAAAPVADAAAPVVADAAAPAAQEEGTVSQLLTFGSAYMQGLLGRGTEAVSRHALTGFAQVLSMGLESVLAKMDGNPATAAQSTALRSVVTALNFTQETGTWSNLCAQMQAAATTLSGLKIYVNGFRIPSSIPSANAARTVGASNPPILQDIIEETPRIETPLDWKKRAEEEKDRLIHNTASLMTLKRIYEKLCRRKPANDQFYIELINRARQNTQGLHPVPSVELENAELKQLFFAKLADEKVNFFVRLFAKGLYFIYGGLVRRLTAKVTTIYFNEVFDYIARSREENFETMRHQITINFTRYLTILGGAYESVAKTEVPGGLPDEMLKNELDKQRSNLGHTSQELYRDCAKTALKKALPFPISWLVWTLGKFFGKPANIIGSMVEKATASIQDPRGYTHALDSTLLEQLDEVWALLQQTERTYTQAQLSEGQKAELRSLVKNLIEILRKAKCDTRGELKDLVQGTSPITKMTQALDNQFIEGVLESVINLFAITMQSLAKKDQLEKLTFKFASMVNSSFMPGEEVTEEHMRDVQHKLAERSEEILRYTINAAVEEKCDFSGEKQQAKMNGLVEELNNQFTTALTAADTDLQALEAMDLTTSAAWERVKKIHKEAQTYQKELHRSTFKVNSLEVSTDNKQELSRRYANIKRESEPFTRSIAALTQQAEILKNIRVTTPHLNAVRTTLAAALGVRIAGNTPLTKEGLDEAENQFKICEAHVAELKKVHSMRTEVAAISARMHEMGAILVALRRTLLQAEMHSTLNRPGSLLEQIVSEKKHHLGSITLMQSSRVSSYCALLRRQLEQSVHTATLPHLLHALHTIETAKQARDVDTARSTLMTLLGQAVEQANVTAGQERGKFRASCDAIQATIDGTRLLDPAYAQTTRDALQASIVTARGLHQTLTTWGRENGHAIPYLNFSPFDLTGLQDWASGLIYGRVREHLDGFTGLVKKQAIYPGLINHLVLLPNTTLPLSTPQA